MQRAAKTLSEHSSARSLRGQKSAGQHLWSSLFSQLPLFSYVSRLAQEQLFAYWHLRCLEADFIVLG